MAEGPQVPVAVGIIVGLLASFVQSLGLTIQRKSHVLNERLPENLQRLEHRRPLWLLGFGIFISSNILGSLFQIASLPVVILAPLGAVSLLWNAFFARLLLGDVFSSWMILGTILIAGGAVLIAIFGIVPEPSHSLEDLLLLFRRPAFVVYFSLLGAAVIVCLIATHAADFSLSKRLARMDHSPPITPTRSSPNMHTLPFPAPEAAARTISESTPLLDRKGPPSRPETPLQHINPALARTRLLVAISYASVSGILSGMCLIFAKSGVELLLLTLGGKNQFWRWESWVLLIGLVVFALLQLWYLHKGLVYADPTIVCPLAFCFYNVSSIVSGLVYYDQFAMLSTLNLCLVALGMLVLLGGVWVVSFHAGNGRVDVGTWQEGDDELTAEERLIDEDLEHEHLLRESMSPHPLESAASETGAMPALSPHHSRHTMRFPSADDAEEVFSHSSAALSPTSPLSPSSPSFNRHRRSTRFSMLHGMDSSSTLSVPAGGFSIGLSPVSPGFAIVPRRRVTSFRDEVQRASMRRVVSESNAHGSGADDELVDGNLLGGADITMPTGNRTREQVEPVRKRAKARWKWLRGVFTGRKT